jgi:hypothetical protein
MTVQPHHAAPSRHVAKIATRRTSQVSDGGRGINRRNQIGARRPGLGCAPSADMIICGNRTGAYVTRNNILYLIVGALVIVVAVLSYQLYQDRKQPEGMRIDLGPNGLSIEKK